MEIFVALGLIAVIGYLIYNKFRRDEHEFSRLYRPVEEGLLDLNAEFGATLAFQGESSFRTETFSLKKGAYKLSYWFPEAVLVKVELFGASGVDSEVIALKRGEGAVDFSVASDGRYFCTIEPAEDDAPWEIEIHPLGLPSRRDEDEI